MEHRNRIDKGVVYAMLGYLGLPGFFRYLFLGDAIACLKEERRELLLLRPLTWLLMAWYFLEIPALLALRAEWTVATWITQSLQSLFPRLIATTAELYFHFQFLADMAALAKKYQPDSGLDQKLLGRRTMYLLLCTARILLSQTISLYSILVQAMLWVLSFLASLSIVQGLFQMGWNVKRAGQIDQ